MYQLSKYLILLIFLCQTTPIVLAQESFRVMFYNVENLFDTKDDSLKNDNEFLPDAMRRWNYYRYRDKVNSIAKVIIASSNEYVPDLVGLCEVENDTCLKDLVRYSPLREADYRYVMTNSPDERGIDVALLYQRGTFKIIEKESIHVPVEKLKKTPTRDILHVAGKVLSGDTLDVLVCHFPSRSGGAKKTEPYRLLASQIVQNTIDSLMQVRESPYFIVMGDFNDGPQSRSLSNLTKTGLHNLLKNKPMGTYRYRGNWEIIDQILVSANILDSMSRIHTSEDKAMIIRYPYLLEEDDKYGGDKPYRTYNGIKYHGGYSDHLPICVDLEIIRDDKDYYSR